MNLVGSYMQVRLAAWPRSILTSKVVQGDGLLIVSTGKIQQVDWVFPKVGLVQQ